MRRELFESADLLRGGAFVMRCGTLEQLLEEIERQSFSSVVVRHGGDTLELVQTDQLGAFLRLLFTDT